MANKLRPVIEGFFDFAQYVEEAPELRELKPGQQRELAAAYLRDYPSELCELFDAVEDYENNVIAGMIDGTVDPDLRKEFDDTLADAAVAVFETGINQRIESMWELYCRDFGKFDADSDHEPGSLRGFAA